MPITSGLERWLKDAGYEYYCFVSWPHTGQDMANRARKIKDRIEDLLALDIPDPGVFFDTSEILVGADWRRQVPKALCRSIAMVSICAPIYFHPSHWWCRLEWAAMDMLSQKRLPNADFKAIIPVLIKRDHPLPSEVEEIQYIDLSGLMVSRFSYHRTNEFEQKMREIVKRIEQIARMLADNQCEADCEQFSLPETPAFGDYQNPPQPFPFRG